jgi:NTP pyrophosphatase (non-canonical NTP hydrolase)
MRDTRAVSELTDLRDRMRRFTEERDWGRFHDPKSLVLALTGEVGEVAELFQWLPAESVSKRALAEPLSSRVSDELADVLLYLVRLADVLDVDLFRAATEKLATNSERFPAEKVRGIAPGKD